MDSAMEDVKDASGDMMDIYPPRPNAIVTLLASNDFVVGTQTLLYSIQKHQKSKKKAKSDSARRLEDYPPELVVLVTPNVTTETRQALYPNFCTRVLEVDYIPFRDGETKEEPASSSSSSSHVSNWDKYCALTKLHIFRLDVYGTVLYVDSDCVVLRDVAQLLHKKGTSHRGLLGAAPDIFPPDKFNAGVLLIRPSAALFQDMMGQRSSLVSYDGGDTGWLNAYYPDWSSMGHCRLPFIYNAQRFLHKCTYAKQPGYWDIGVGPDLTIVHFSSSPKPWQILLSPSSGAATSNSDLPASYLNDADQDSVKESGAGGDDLDQLWLQHYKESQEWAAKEESRRAKERKEAQVAAAAAAKKKAAVQKASSSSSSNNKSQQHKDLTRRYRELRKTGMSVKEAMAQARRDVGMEEANQGTAASQVAAMFGMA